MEEIYKTDRNILYAVSLVFLAFCIEPAARSFNLSYQIFNAPTGPFVILPEKKKLEIDYHTAYIHTYIYISLLVSCLS